jgi:hypothetical protein
MDLPTIWERTCSFLAVVLLLHDYERGKNMQIKHLSAKLMPSWEGASLPVADVATVGYNFHRCCEQDIGVVGAAEKMGSLTSGRDKQSIQTSCKTCQNIAFQLSRSFLTFYLAVVLSIILMCSVVVRPLLLSSKHILTVTISIRKGIPGTGAIALKMAFTGIWYLQKANKKGCID